jgi:hypothetical protein
MSGRVSLAPTNDRHDADRLHPLHRTESDRDLAYLIRTSLRFSAQQERGAQLADFIGDSQSREARICSVRSDSSSGGLPSSDRLHTSSRRIRAASRGCSDRGKVHPAGTGRKPYPRCLASGSSDRTVRQWVGHRPSGRLPADQLHRYCRPGGVQARQNSRRGRWDKSVLLWDVATHLARAVLVQPIFELVLLAALT